MPTFDNLPTGIAFRFYHRGEPVTALKTFFPKGDDAVILVLTPTNAGLKPGDLLPRIDGGEIIELKDVTLVPSSKAGTVTPGKNNFAKPGEIERHGNTLTFVTRPQGGMSYRVNLLSGAIGTSTGAAPVEIYSEWSVIQKVGAKHEVMYTHAPEPEADEGSVTVILND